MIDVIKEWYWSVLPYDYRPSNLWQKFLDWAWYRYRTVKPRTLPGHSWVDRDQLLYHSCFEILSQFMEKELKGYREEDWEYYYKEQPDRLVQFGLSKKDPYYILDYLYRWFPFYLDKEEKLGDAWGEFHQLHCTSEFVDVEGTKFFNWMSKWDTPENEKIGKLMFKRYCKKREVLHKELEENLILLIKCKDFLWT